MRYHELRIYAIECGYNDYLGNGAAKRYELSYDLTSGRRIFFTARIHASDPFHASLNFEEESVILFVIKNGLILQGDKCDLIDKDKYLPKFNQQMAGLAALKDRL